MDICCPESLNISFFKKLSHDDQKKCIKLFNKMQKLTYSELFNLIISFCTFPVHDNIKCHLFGLFIDIPRQLIAYYPETFLKIAHRFLKTNQSITGIERYFSKTFSIIYDLKLDFEYVLFEEFIQIGHSICKCNQTESNIKYSYIKIKMILSLNKIIYL